VTADDLEKMEETLIGQLFPWVFKSGRKIESHVEDAKAHALNALTGTVRDAPDGRETVAKLGRSRSARAALDHVDELQRDLDAIIRDARAKFYANSIELWLPFIDADDRAPGAGRVVAAVAGIMADGVISGYTLEMRLSPAIETHTRNLRAQLNMGAASAAKDRPAADRIKTWATLATRGLTKATESILSDSQTAIHEATGWLLIHPSKRGERLVDPGVGLAFPKDA
jgi:hypothetical protein